MTRLPSHARPLLFCFALAGTPLARAMAPILVVVSLASCQPGGGGHAGFTMPPTPVEVSDVAPQLVRQQFRALGSIDADESVQLVSEVSGRVVRLPFAEGAPIEQGALVAALDDRAATAEVTRTEAQQELAQSNADRAEKLSKDGVISQSEMDDARASLRVAQANASAARVTLDKTRIRAPFSGMIGRRRISPGAYVSAGDVIAEMARTNVMKVRFAAPERELEHLGKGRRVEVTTPALPGETFTGEISVVDPLIDPQTRTVQIVARVANPNRRLQAGMSGNVAVTLAERPHALTVPDEAVFAEGNQSFVFVVNPDSTVQRAAVRLGIRDSSRVEIVDGLEPGARVVRTGHQKLYPGARVMPIPSGGPGAGGPGGAPQASAGPGGGTGSTAAKPATTSPAAAKAATKSAGKATAAATGGASGK